MATPVIPDLRVTYFLDITSSWCWWAEKAWTDLKQGFGEQVTFDWKIALMDATAFPVSREQCDWFYRRSGLAMRSAYALNSGWWEAGLGQYLAPNQMAEAARSLGFGDDRVRLALARAALREGRRIGSWEVAAEVAAVETGQPAALLLALARSPEIEERVREDTRSFHALAVTQRPTFLLESRIGDRAVFSGIARTEPLRAAIVALLEDVAAYAAHAAHLGDPPMR
jgi:predicted DsbA family dithiol-disulfide isomerase